MIVRDGRKSWAIVGVLGIAVGVAFMDRVILSVAAAPMAKEFGFSATVTGLLLAAFFWSYALVQVPAGWLIDRYGTRRTLAAGYALWSLSCVFMGWAASLPALLLCRLGLGVGEGPVYPSGYRLVATHFSEHNRALASAVYSEGSKIGPAIAAPLAAWLITAYGWRTMFVIIGLASLLWLVPWFAVAPTASEEVKAGEKISAREIARLLKLRETWGIAIGYFGYLYVFYVYITWLPGYLVMERGLTLLKAGWYSALPFLVQLLVGLIGAWITDRFIAGGYSTTIVRKTAIGVGLLFGLAIVPAGFASDAALAVTFFCISLAGLGIAVPNMLAVPSAIAPAGRGGIIGGIQSTGGNLGGAIAPLVTGAIYDVTHSFLSALLVAGFMLVVCAFGYLVLIRRIEVIEISVESTNRDITMAGVAVD